MDILHFISDITMMTSFFSTGSMCHWGCHSELGDKTHESDLQKTQTFREHIHDENSDDRNEKHENYRLHYELQMNAYTLLSPIERTVLNCDTSPERATILRNGPLRTDQYRHMRDMQFPPGDRYSPRAICCACQAIH